jgi:hypothetical protein
MGDRQRRGADWWSVIWGAETDALLRAHDELGQRRLFYEAEGRTVLGGAATAVGPTGASGAGSNVVRHTSLTNTEQAILSTQATGGGAHLSHVGTFRVYCSRAGAVGEHGQRVDPARVVGRRLADPRRATPR